MCIAIENMNGHYQKHCMENAICATENEFITKIKARRFAVKIRNYIRGKKSISIPKGIWNSLSSLSYGMLFIPKNVWKRLDIC